MANFRKRGPQQWQAQIRKKGYPPQVKTFNTRISRRTLGPGSRARDGPGHFHVPYRSRIHHAEGAPGALPGGSHPVEARCRTRNRPPPRAAPRPTGTTRIVAGIRGVDVARYRDERLKEVSPGTVKRDLVIISHLFEVARKEWGIPVANPVRDIKMPAHNKARDRRLESSSGGKQSEEVRLLDACREARNPYLLTHRPSCA